MYYFGTILKKIIMILKEVMFNNMADVISFEVSILWPAIILSLSWRALITRISENDIKWLIRNLCLSIYFSHIEGLGFTGFWFYWNTDSGHLIFTPPPPKRLVYKWEPYNIRLPPEGAPSHQRGKTLSPPHSHQRLLISLHWFWHVTASKHASLREVTRTEALQTEEMPR